MGRKAYLLRIDEAVYEKLREWAEDEFRSVNGHIEYLLRQALEKRGVKLPGPQKTEEPKEE